MISPRSARQTMGTLVAIVALLMSSSALGLHAGGAAIGGSSLEPTTIYYSQHSQGSDEEHLHDLTGFESIFCLACFLSVRNQTVLEVSAALFALAEVGERLPNGFSSAPLAIRSKVFSSRAPPRA